MSTMKLILGAAAALLAGATIPAAGQDAAPSGVSAQQSAWVSRCASDGREATPECSVDVRVSLANGQLVAGVTVRVPADTREPVLMIHIPLGVYLPAGTTITIDQSTQRPFELQTCDATGCFAGGQVTPDLLSALTNGTTLNLTFQNLNRQPITVPIALKGFADAYQKVE